MNKSKARTTKKLNLGIGVKDYLPSLRCYDNYEITVASFYNDGTKPVKFNSDHNDLEQHARDRFGDEIARMSKTYPATNLVVTLKSGKRYMLRKSRLNLG